MPAKKLPELIDSQTSELRTVRDLEAMIAATVQHQLAAALTPKSSSAQIAQPAMPPRPIMLETCESLWNAIQQVHSNVLTLINKIDPVLLQQQAEATQSGATPSQQRGPLANELGSLTESLHSTNSLLTDALARLTL